MSHLQQGSHCYCQVSCCYCQDSTLSLLLPGLNTAPATAMTHTDPATAMTQHYPCYCRDLHPGGVIQPASMQYYTASMHAVLHHHIAPPPHASCHLPLQASSPNLLPLAWPDQHPSCTTPPRPARFLLHPVLVFLVVFGQ